MEIVNDEYWLKYGKSSIEQSLTSRNAAAAKLEKMTLWFWGLYTASFTIGVSVNVIEAPGFILFLLSLPVVLLILTYWFCILAQLPVNAEFDPTIPYEIKEAFNAGLKVKNRRFLIARILTLISALFLSCALFMLSFVNKKGSHSLDVTYNQVDSTLIVSGIFPKGIVVTTKIDSIRTKLERMNLYTNRFKIQENGILNLNIPLAVFPKELIVSTTWIEKKEIVGFTKTIKK